MISGEKHIDPRVTNYYAFQKLLKEDYVRIYNPQKKYVFISKIHPLLLYENDCAFGECGCHSFVRLARTVLFPKAARGQRFALYCIRK